MQTTCPMYSIMGVLQAPCRSYCIMSVAFCDLIWIDIITIYVSAGASPVRRLSKSLETGGPTNRLIISQVHSVVAYQVKRMHNKRFSYLLNVLERRCLYSVRVWARVHRPSKLVILARLSSVSENDSRTYLSAVHVIDLILQIGLFCEVLKTNAFHDLFL